MIKEFADDSKTARRQAAADFASTMQNLEPTAEGRWSGANGRQVLATAAFEAGWDAAVVALRNETVRP